MAVRPLLSDDTAADGEPEHNPEQSKNRRDKPKGRKGRLPVSGKSDNTEDNREESGRESCEPVEPAQKGHGADHGEKHRDKTESTPQAPHFTSLWASERRQRLYHALPSAATMRGG